MGLAVLVDPFVHLGKGGGAQGEHSQQPGDGLHFSSTRPGMGGQSYALRIPAASKARERDGVLDRVGVANGLVLADAKHAREAHRDSRLVAFGALDALESQLEDELRLHDAHRTEALDRALADERVDLADLLVGETRIRLRERHQLVAIPQAERVVGEEARALAVARLRVDEDGIERVRLDLPLPPHAARPADAILRIEALDHEAFRSMLAALRARLRERFPARRPQLAGDEEARFARNRENEI